MRVANLQDIADDMEKGVYNFCKDGECSKCGNCCSALLPISKKEIKDIKRYVKKKRIKPVNHRIALMPCIDLTCPFLDNTKDDKCLIYPVRPSICKVFRCDKPPSEAEKDRHKLSRNCNAVNMWNIDWGC